MHATKIFNFSLTLLLILCSTNCSHYSVIPTDKTPFKTIYVHTISNQSYAPNIHILLQNQIKQTILRDNRATIAKNPVDADTQLFVTLDDYRRSVNTRSSSDAGRFNSLNLGVVILVSLYDNGENTYLFKNVPLDCNEYLFFNPVEESIVHREMEYQILPKITRELSEDILELILNDWPESFN